jgi:hypothetical protein
MGEIAEAIISGLFCQGCGEVIDDTEPGYARFCRGCQPTPRGYVSKAKPRGAHGNVLVLGNKLVKRLRMITEFTKRYGGMYPGVHWDEAVGQHAKLERHGLITRYLPHNPVHKDRAVVTDYGREYLARLAEEGERG